VGNRRYVTSVKSDFHTKLKKLDVQEVQKERLLADHETQICEAHDWVTVSFLQQVQGFARPDTKGSRVNIGHNVHVYGDISLRRNKRSQIVKAEVT